MEQKRVADALLVAEAAAQMPSMQATRAREYVPWLYTCNPEGEASIIRGNNACCC